MSALWKHRPQDSECHERNKEGFTEKVIYIWILKGDPDIHRERIKNTTIGRWPLFIPHISVEAAVEAVMFHKIWLQGHMELPLHAAQIFVVVSKMLSWL